MYDSLPIIVDGIAYYTVYVYDLLWCRIFVTIRKQLSQSSNHWLELPVEHHMVRQLVFCSRHFLKIWLHVWATCSHTAWYLIVFHLNTCKYIFPKALIQWQAHHYTALCSNPFCFFLSIASRCTIATPDTQHHGWFHSTNYLYNKTYLRTSDHADEKNPTHAMGTQHTHTISPQYICLTAYFTSILCIPDPLLEPSLYLHWVWPWKLGSRCSGQSFLCAAAYSSTVFVDSIYRTEGEMVWSALFKVFHTSAACAASEFLLKPLR